MKHFGSGFNTFRFTNLLQTADDVRIREAFEIKTLAAAEDRFRYAVDFGGGEEELDVRRRLFERLEESVESLLGEHVYFVNDVNLETGTSGHIADVVTNLAHFVDAAVRCAVELHHVHIFADGYLMADFTFVARLGRRSLLAVQRFREDACHRGFAYAAGTAEQVSMRHPLRLNRVFQSG